jgi:hypothetical protein
MLFRDIKFLCEALMFGDTQLQDYKRVVTLNTEVGPVLARPPFQLDAPTEHFSSTENQKALLEPFRREFREMPHITISGTVDEAVI